MPPSRACTLLAVLALTLVALVPAAPALDPVDETRAYGEWEGHFLAGGPWTLGRVTAGPSGVVDAGPVNRATHAFRVNDCHRDVRIHLDFTPSALDADAGVAAARVPFVFEAWLVHAASSARVHPEPLEWRSPGAFTLIVPDAGAFELDLRLRQGADVAYALRVTGWRTPDVECRHQGRVLVTEVEANPEGADAGAEWVEVANAGFDAVDLTNWRVHAGHASRALPGNLTLAPGARVVVAFEDAFLPNADARVTLTAPRGWVVDATPALTDDADDARSWQRVPDTGDAWAFLAATPGAAAEP